VVFIFKKYFTLDNYTRIMKLIKQKELDKVEELNEKEEYRYFLKAMRTSIGFTIVRMSEEIGIDKSKLADYESGRRNVPYPEYLEKKIRQVVKRFHQVQRVS
jgi:predicted transcriptional regulator